MYMQYIVNFRNPVLAVANIYHLYDLVSSGPFIDD